MFPFNYIEIDQTFLAEINNFTRSYRVAALSDVLFQTFELNDNDYYSPLFDVDPNVNFYNEIDLHAYVQCLNFDFSTIGICKTWLSDNNRDLFYLNGCNLVENTDHVRKD